MDLNHQSDTGSSAKETVRIKGAESAFGDVILACGFRPAIYKD
jgi:hypothetical protein